MHVVKQHDLDRFIVLEGFCQLRGFGITNAVPTAMFFNQGERRGKGERYSASACVLMNCLDTEHVPNISVGLIDQIY